MATAAPKAKETASSEKASEKTRRPQAIASPRSSPRSSASRAPIPAAIEAVNDTSKGQSRTSPAVPMNSTGSTPARASHWSTRRRRYTNRSTTLARNDAVDDDRVREKLLHPDRRLDALVDQRGPQKDVLAVGSEQDVEVESPPEEQWVPVIAEERQVREQDEEQDSGRRDGDGTTGPGGQDDREQIRPAALAGLPGSIRSTRPTRASGGHELSAGGEDHSGRRANAQT